MKIAFVVEEFPKISETFVLNQATGLIDLGHEVDIFCFKIGDTKIMHSNIEKYGLLEKAICLNPLFTFSNSVKETYLALDEKLTKKIGFKLPLLKAFRYIRSWASVALFLLKFRLSHSSKKSSYDIIHCQFGTAGLRFLPFYKLRILRGKLIVQFRGHDVTEFVRQEGPKIYRNLFQEADYFMPVCEYLRKKAVGLGCPKDKILIMKSSVDLRRFEYLERSRLGSVEVTRVIFVGRLVEKKGVEYAIRALSLLKQRGYNVELLIVGDGPLKKNLERICRDSDVEEEVIFLGAKNHDRLFEILKTADLFVAPSVTARTGDQEGIPNALKEAMATGLPVVSTCHGGIAELVKDGVSGFLVLERDAEAIADKIAYLIDHPEIWKKMGRAGREFVEKNFDKDKLNQQLVDIYRRLLIKKVDEITKI